MSEEELIAELTRHYNWSRGTFEIWKKAGFRCEYCNRDFLQSLDSYKQAKVDHLLPQSSVKYAALINSASNHVLSCDVCNNLKRNWDPLKEEGGIAELDPEATQLAPKVRQELLSRAVNRVRELRIKREEKFLREKKLIWEWMAKTGS